MPYLIREVDAAGSKFAADTIHRLNRMVPETFPELTSGHLENGFWWLAYSVDNAAQGDDVLVPVAFAGLVPMEPFEKYGYAKRAYVAPDHRGHGLQQKFLALRERKAKELGWIGIVSECGGNNVRSIANFQRAGFVETDPEQPWGKPGDVYWLKRLN